jgi:hypothetical protein
MLNKFCNAPSNIFQDLKFHISDIEIQSADDRTVPKYLYSCVYMPETYVKDVDRQARMSIQGGSVSQSSVANAADGNNNNNDMQLPKLKFRGDAAASFLLSTHNTPPRHRDYCLTQSIPFRIRCIIESVP